jgi:hypothetical protein
MLNAPISDYGIAAQGLFQSILQGTEVSNRKTLGQTVPIKLFQVLRLIGMGTSVESMVGAGSPALVYQSGQQLGMTLGSVVYTQSGKNMLDYLKRVRELCLTLTIGLVSLEKSDDRKKILTLRVDECVSCAGIAGVKAPICHYEAGLVGGLVKHFASAADGRPRNTKAIETRCNAVGDNTCAIDVEVLS